MGTPGDDELTRARRRFDRLLRLYPRRYRQRYGIPLRDTLLDQYRALPRAARVARRYWLRQALDTAANALPLHLADLATGAGPVAPHPVRAGALVGALAALCLALGAALYELPASPLARLGEVPADALCLAFLLLICAGGGWWAARGRRALARGVAAGAVAGGLAGLGTGLAYLALDQLRLAAVMGRPERLAAFAHSGFASPRAYLLVGALVATVALALAGLIVGAFLGGVGGGARRLRRVLRRQEGG